MLTYARLSLGRGFRPDRAFLYYAQRLIGLRIVRIALSSLIAAGVRILNGRSARTSPDSTRKRTLVELRRVGLARLQPLAAATQIDAMVAYFRACRVMVDRKTSIPLDALDPTVAIAEYDLGAILGCPYLLALVNAPAIIQLAEAYLGCRPTLSSLGVRWTFPVEAAAARFQSYHRDIDDWRFLKLFIYLTPVTQGAGPHEYVLGSHLHSFGLRAKAYDRRELEVRYGPENLVAVTGPAGTTFVGDTIGIHRGGCPSSEPRLLLVAQYSILPVFMFNYEPQDPTWTPADVDAYCSRLFVRRNGAHSVSADGDASI
ncbi:MAG: hypothetical protein JWO33_2559 [Caulobacteraceae bacterium]|nr:hypothetical protein [Caulobacteraceae bacterium]